MAHKLTYITSRDNSLLIRLRKLARQPGEYRRSGQVLLEGEHLCEAWAARGPSRPLQALVSETAWQEGRFVELADAAAATVVVADAALIDIGTLETPAPIAFVVALPAIGQVDATSPTVILDRIQDAGNVGSILRSAAAFGFVQVVAIRGTASLWSPKVLRAGMGSHLALALHEGADAAAIADLRSPLLGSSSHATAEIGEADLPWPCSWVFGNEGEGVSAELDSRCAARYRIPQRGGEESLNVAVAAGICLYESVRRITRP